MAVPEVYAEQRTRTAVMKPAAFICQTPGALAVAAYTRDVAAFTPGAIAGTANQFAPSSVASKVSVAENVPVTAHATEAVSELTPICTQAVVVPVQLEACAVKLPYAVPGVNVWLKAATAASSPRIAPAKIRPMLVIDAVPP
jgi:hypothetical protein